MKWSQEGKKKLQRVPFFIRRMVKKKVEDYAKENSIEIIRPEHLDLLKERFMKNQANDLKGYSVDTCLGADGCPNRTLPPTDIADELEKFFEKQRVREFLLKKLNGKLKMHNEFRVSISFCPNACSRPQIVDLGLIGAVVPEIKRPNSCNMCRACVKVCREEAIKIGEKGPEIDIEKCLYCGSCIKVCKEGVLNAKKTGFRCLVGGKLGRHPQLGHELPIIFSDKEIYKITKKIVSFFKTNCQKGERLGTIISQKGLSTFYKAIDIPKKG